MHRKNKYGVARRAAWQPRSQFQVDSRAVPAVWMGCSWGKACHLPETRVPDAPGMAEYGAAAAVLAVHEVGGHYRTQNWVTVRMQEDPESEILTELKPGQSVQIEHLSSPPRCRALVAYERFGKTHAGRGWIQLVPPQQLRKREGMECVLVEVSNPFTLTMVKFPEQESMQQ